MAYFLCGEGSSVTVTVDGVEVEEGMNLVSDGAIDLEVGTLPYQFNYSSAVVYNKEIHILGSGISGYYTSHYKYNGTSWTSVSTLPYDFSRAKKAIGL